MRKNQKGFTLVELIIAVAILAIVTLAVCGFIVVGSRSYTSANTDIMLQQDAQLALNQISDVIIDTTDSISYGVRAGGVGDMQLVLKDSEFGGEATEKCLAIVNKNEAGSTNDNESYWFYWSKDDEIIYFNKVEAYSSTMSMSEIQSKFAEAADQSKVSILAQHVTDFSVDLTQFDANRVVMLSVTFENGNRVYSTSNNVTVRNRIALNELTVGPLKRAEEFVINTVTSVVLEPGDTYSLASKVAVTTPSDDQAIKFEQVGGDQYGTRVDAAGMVTIGKEDMRGNFSVRVSRINEQYAGENDRIAKTIRVNIKRATDVNITGPASAKQGETVDLTGSARGNMLGERCDQCIGDDLSKDRDVYDWKVISGKATIVTSDDGAATVKIASDAEVGEDIVIQAASVLSRNKNGGYGPASAPTVPPVTGIWRIKVQKGTEGDFPIEGGFKFGTDNDPGPLDYMRSHLRTDFGYYIYAVRVREMNAPDASQDMVVLYETTGANERFFPDLFGLKLDRSYKVFFQVFVPVSKETIAKKQKGEIGSYFADDRETIVNEYLDNVDSNGKYIGDRYEADGLYYGLLSIPTISVTYNGIAYPNNLTDLYETCVWRNVGAGSSVMNQPSLSDAINVDRNKILNSIHYSVFKDGQQVYEYKELSKGSFGYEGNPNIAGGALKVETGSMILKKDQNVDANDQILGTYTIVPGFTYKNDLNIRQYKYLYPVDAGGNLDTSKFKEKFGGDYDEHYYPQDGSVITLKIIDEGNLPLTTAAGTLKIYVSLPTEGDFTSKEWGKYGFDLEREGLQGPVEKKLAAYNADGTFYKYITVRITCQYIKSEMAYKLTITSNDGREDYGKYKCKYGENKWTCTETGTASAWSGLSDW